MRIQKCCERMRVATMVKASKCSTFTMLKKRVLNYYPSGHADLALIFKA
jgi:hypothetical protein